MSLRHVPIGLIPGPFHERLNALSRTQGWMDWAGYLSPSVLDTAEFEIEIDIDDVGLDSEGGTIELGGLDVEVT